MRFLLGFNASAMCTFCPSAVECTTKHSLLLARYQNGRGMWKAWRGVHGCGLQAGAKFMRQGPIWHSRCPAATPRQLCQAGAVGRVANLIDYMGVIGT